ncbi:MAG: 50S ribosomal protein L5 [Mycoplasmataceae bacterium]|nr:50S ribosomal protein L5 [Mycoplasmataceae bacterium]
MSLNLKTKYEKKIKDALMTEFSYKSVMEVPKLEKIVINAGVGDGAADAKFIEAMSNEIQVITGQKPILTKSKKAIATFKLRENQAIGVKVTLRGERMWNFVENLVNVALPRVRDFKGVSNNSFDGRGNYTIGIKEQIIFTEINYDDIKRVRGFDVTFVTSTKKNEVAKAMLKAIGLPFAKQR